MKRESACVCLCEREIQGEREIVSVCVRERERQGERETLLIFTDTFSYSHFCFRINGLF